MGGHSWPSRTSNKSKTKLTQRDHHPLRAQREEWKGEYLTHLQLFLHSSVRALSDTVSGLRNAGMNNRRFSLFLHKFKYFSFGTHYFILDGYSIHNNL